MKKIIVVQNAYDDLEFTKQSIESIRCAAHRWKSNFYEITHFQFPNAPENIFWDKLWIFENFRDYDLVLMLDADIVINKDAPNIFDQISSDYDFAAVLDGNPNGRFQFDDNWYRKKSHEFHLLHGSVKIFDKYIPNFDKDLYWKYYFNMGVFLFRPSIMYPNSQEIKKLLFNNIEFYNYLDRFKNNSIFAGQNTLSAFISTQYQKLKLLDNTWNWIAPDDFTEYNQEMFLGKMKPYIYHFAGTPDCKNYLKTYDRWK